MVKLYKTILIGITCLVALSLPTFAQPGFTGNLVNQYVVDGDNLMKIGDFNGAIAAYTNAIGSNIGFGEAYVKRAIAYNLQGRATEGRNDMNKALQINPAFAVMYDTLTTKKMRKDSLATVSNPYGNFDIDNTPADTSTFFNVANSFLTALDYRGSIKYLKGYLKKNPNDTLTLTLLALAYVNNQTYDSAFSYIKKLAVVDKTSPMPNAVYGLYNYKRGYYIDAIENFNKAIKIDPDFSIAYFNRAVCKKRMGNDRGYDDDFELALNADAKVANTYYNRSYFETRDGSLQAANDDYNKAKENSPAFKNKYYESVASKRLLTDYFALYNEYTDGIDKNKSAAEPYAERGNFLLLFGEYTPAVIDYNKAITLNPVAADYLFNRGMARLLKNDNMSGCRDIKKSLEMGVDKAGPILDNFCK